DLFWRFRNDVKVFIEGFVSLPLSLVSLASLRTAATGHGCAKPGPKCTKSFLPTLPVHIVELEIAGNGNANCRKEILFAKLCEQSKSLQLVLYRIFQLGETKLDAPLVQRLVQLRNCVACGDVHAGDRFRRNDQPTHGPC